MASRWTQRISRLTATGTYSPLGRAGLSLTPGTNRAVSPVSAVFATAGVVPTGGATYQLEVIQHTPTQIDGPLGAVTLSLAP